MILHFLFFNITYINLYSVTNCFISIQYVHYCVAAIRYSIKTLSLTFLYAFSEKLQICRLYFRYK
jgi:hypothetical protein